MDMYHFTPTSGHFSYKNPQTTIFGTDTVSRKQSKFWVTKEHILYHNLIHLSTNHYQFFQWVHCNTLKEKKQKAGVKGMKT